MRYLAITLVFILLQVPLSYKERQTLNMFYTVNYKGDTWANHRTALLWALSYLGASLPQASLDKAILWQDSTSFSLNLDELGFSDKAMEALSILADSIKN